MLRFTEACRDIQLDPEAGWKAVIDVNWTLHVLPLVSHRMIFTLPEMVMSTLNKTMRACPSTSAAATLTELYTRLLRDPGITPRVFYSLVYHEMLFMTSIERAWIGDKERKAVRKWREAHARVGFVLVPCSREVEEAEEEVPESIRDIWNRLPRVYVGE